MPPNHKKEIKPSACGSFDQCGPLFNQRMKGSFERVLKADIFYARNRA
jgi:hypothetical protein